MTKLLRTLWLATAVTTASTTVQAAETVLLEKDFSTLTEGTEAAPKLYTSAYALSGWTIVANKTGQAGGSLYLADGGYAKLSSLSGVTTTGGAIKYSAVVKLNKATAGIIQLTWGYSTTFQQVVEADDWTTVEFIVTPTSASSYSNGNTLQPQWLADGIFVKSIKISQSPDFLASPTAAQPSQADGTSFTASWKAVTGATKYFIDVYSYDAEGNKAYFINNQEVSGTSYSVTGLDPTVTYYYVVRAGNDTGVSASSAEIEVVKVISSLATPEVSLASYDETTGAYTLEWNAVADADDYSVTVYKSETMAEAGLANVFSETFNCYTTGSLSNIEYAYDRHLEALNEPGWSGYNMAYINGALGITPYGSEAWIATPAIDLSADGGTFTVKVNMCANSYGTFKTGDVVNFYTIDADGNESEPVAVTIDKAAFADYEVPLTGGTAATKIKMGCSGNRIFFDNLEVKQNKPAGSVTTGVYTTGVTEACQYSGTVAVAANTVYKAAVVANGRTVAASAITGISSSPSALVVLGNTSGMAQAAVENAPVVGKQGNAVTVIAAETTAVEIYDTTGRCVAKTTVAPGTSTFAVSAKGLLIVKAGATTAKIVL